MREIKRMLLRRKIFEIINKIRRKTMWKGSLRKIWTKIMIKKTDVNKNMVGSNQISLRSTGQSPWEHAVWLALARKLLGWSVKSKTKSESTKKNEDQILGLGHALNKFNKILY